MRPEQRKKLDGMLRRQRAKAFLMATLVAGPALLFILLLIVWWFDPAEVVAERAGTIVGLAGANKYLPSSPRLIVELELGRTVNADGTEHLLHERGRKVILQELEGMILGRSTFRFLRYADE